MAKYQKGESGNPNGRPKGVISHRKFREAILKDAPEIIESMITLAKSGDVSAAKIVLDRVFPTMKPGDSLLSLPMTGNLSDDARQVLISVGNGAITPDQGSKLLSCIGSLAKVIEIDELIRRVEALEAAGGVEG
jgi:hypothetical protein